MNVGSLFSGIGGIELGLLGIKRKGLPVKRHDISQVLQTAREIHSKKPHTVYSHIEALYGPTERLELFARNRRESWDAWGNELTLEVQYKLSTAQEQNNHFLNTDNLIKENRG